VTAAASARRVLAADSAAELPGLAARLGWTALGSLDVREAGSVETAWRIGPEHTFHHVVSAAYGVHHCQVFGPDPDEPLRTIGRALRFLDVDAVAAAFDAAGNPRERAAATYALGLAAGTASEAAVLTRLVRALEDLEPAVRIAAVDAAFVTRRPELLALVGRLRDDPDAGVRAVATTAIDEAGRA